MTAIITLEQIWRFCEDALDAMGITKETAQQVIQKGGEFQQKETKMTAMITLGQAKQIRRFCEDALDAMGITKETAQQVIQKGGEFQQKFKDIITELGGILPYADEQTASSYGYPDGFRIRTVQEQVKTLLKLFPNLDYSHVQELAGGELPARAEGRGVIPDYRLVAKLHQACNKTLTDEQKYCLAIEVVLGKLKEKREFKNWREGVLTEKHLRLNKKAAQAYAKLNEQIGGCRLISFQFGKRWAGHSVRNAQARFADNEFGLGPYEVAILLLTHPDRITGLNQLYVDCAGCEYRPGAGGDFFACLYFGWSSSYERLDLSDYRTNLVSKRFGAVSGFLTQ